MFNTKLALKSSCLLLSIFNLQINTKLNSGCVQKIDKNIHRWRQNLKTEVKKWYILCVLFLAQSGIFNYMIIHLWALIYPPPLPLCAPPFCDSLHRISNEQRVKTRQSSSNTTHLGPYLFFQHETFAQMSDHMWSSLMIKNGGAGVELFYSFQTQ